jgi:hypothetical protein
LGTFNIADCYKDFYGNEYDVHISEAERYSGKGYVLKASLNKGQHKQEDWLEIVRSIQAKANIFNDGVNEIIKTIGERDNVPRKKDFYGNEYDVHISEAERYSGKGYVLKASLNKAQHKQEDLLEIVRSIQAKANIFNDGVNEIIKTIGERDNVPRKKDRFIIFLKNVDRRVQQRDVEEESDDDDGGKKLVASCFSASIWCSRDPFQGK